MKLLKKIGALQLALLVLLSSTSWTLAEHYCMGRLVEVSLFTETHGCGMEAMQDVLGDDKDVFSCCSEETLVIDGLDQFKTVTDKAFDIQPDLVQSSFINARPIASVTSDLTPVPNYRPPPLIIRDYQILFEVYLI